MYRTWQHDHLGHHGPSTSFFHFYGWRSSNSISFFSVQRTAWSYSREKILLLEDEVLLYLQNTPNATFPPHLSNYEPDQKQCKKKIVIKIYFSCRIEIISVAKKKCVVGLHNFFFGVRICVVVCIYIIVPELTPVGLLFQWTIWPDG